MACPQFPGAGHAERTLERSGYANRTESESLDTVMATAARADDGRARLLRRLPSSDRAMVRQSDGMSAMALRMARV